MKQDIVKSKLMNILGVSTAIKVYARKTTVGDISTELAREFLNKNHIQGYTTSAIKRGLFYKDQLVSVILFNKLRDNMNKGGYKNS